VRDNLAALLSGGCVILARMPAFDLRRAAAWGTTWAVTVTVVEALEISPVDAWGSARQLLFWLIYWVLPFWCIVGAIFVWLSSNTEGPRSLPGLIGSFVVLSVVASSLQPLASAGLMKLMPSPVITAGELVAVRPLQNWLSISMYNLWVNLFYGALLITACRVTLRDQRIRHRLHQFAMSRSRTQALLDTERLQALQTQIDPNLLLDAMQELKQRYRTNPENAERLLEALVEFLRHAMQGLRTSVSTVSAEVQLARAFAQLQRERGFDGAWRVVEELAQEPQVSFKFPSLLMLPLLALGGDGGRPVLRIQTHETCTVLSLHGLAEDVPVNFLQQMRSRLLVLYKERFKIEMGSMTRGSLVITLNADPLNRGEQHDESR
jgi:hypothetical protein